VKIRLERHPFERGDETRDAEDGEANVRNMIIRYSLTANGTVGSVTHHQPRSQTATVFRVS
jgi:hypothetical protein